MLSLKGFKELYKTDYKYILDIVLFAPDVIDSYGDTYDADKAFSLYNTWVDNFYNKFDLLHNFVTLDDYKINLVGIKILEDDVLVRTYGQKEIILKAGTIIGTIEVDAFIGKLYEDGLLTGTSIVAHKYSDFAEIVTLAGSDNLSGVKDLALRSSDINIIPISDFGDDWFVSYISLVDKPSNPACVLLSLDKKSLIQSLKSKVSHFLELSSVSKVSKEQYIVVSPLSTTSLKGGDDFINNESEVFDLTQEEIQLLIDSAVEALKTETETLKSEIDVLKTETENLKIEIETLKVDDDVEDENINEGEENINEPDLSTKSRQPDYANDVIVNRRKFGWE